MATKQFFAENLFLHSRQLPHILAERPPLNQPNITRLILYIFKKINYIVHV